MNPEGQIGDDWMIRHIIAGRSQTTLEILLVIMLIDIDIVLWR